METTGQAIMSKVSGSISSAISAGIKLNTDIAKQEEANKMATNKIQARKTQSANFKNRIDVLKVKPDSDTMQVFKGGVE